MTTIKFTHDGFGIHRADTSHGRYLIEPITYHRNGKPYGYRAFHITIGNKTSIDAHWTFSACRAACKAHATEQAA